MATSIQTVPSVVLSALGSVSSSPRLATTSSSVTVASETGSLFDSVPGVIVTLNTAASDATPAIPLTFTASGALDLPVPFAASTATANGTNVAATTGNNGTNDGVASLADASQTNAAPATTAATAQNATNAAASAATIDATTAISLSDLVTLLGINSAAVAGSSVLNTSISLQSLPTATVQALIALTTSGGAGEQAVNQALVRQLLTGNAAATSGTEITATNVFNAPNALAGLPSTITVEALNNLLTTNLGAEGAVLLNSAGVAATNATAAANGALVATLPTTATTPGTENTTSLNTLLLGNVDLTAAATPALATTTTATPTGRSSTIGKASSSPVVVAPAGGSITPVPVSAGAALAPAPATAVTNLAATAATATATGGETAAVAQAVANNFLVDYVSQALATISGNPTYANAASALYANVAIFRQQQAVATLPSTTATVHEPTEVPNVKTSSRYSGIRNAA